jgi:BirA family biotin operon repressor/biotin-[acetyl-CoA-carboxylase] ligase
MWMTLVVPDPARAVAPLAPLRAALAAAAQIDHALGERGLARIRWPNDLLLGGAKVGGILGETTGPALLIGLGLNVNNRPADLGPGLRTPATSLAAHAGRPIDLDALVGGLTGRLIRALGASGPGAEPGLRPDEAHDLNARLADRGRTVEVSGAGAPVAGVLLGVDPDGALRVEVAGETRRFVSGEVSCRAVESPRAETMIDD